MTFTYKASDGQLNSNTATVSITVADAPEAEHFTTVQASIGMRDVFYGPNSFYGDQDLAATPEQTAAPDILFPGGGSNGGLQVTTGHHVDQDIDFTQYTVEQFSFEFDTDRTGGVTQATLTSNNVSAYRFTDGPAPTTPTESSYTVRVYGYTDSADGQGTAADWGKSVLLGQAEIPVLGSNVAQSITFDLDEGLLNYLLSQSDGGLIGFNLQLLDHCPSWSRVSSTGRWYYSGVGPSAGLATGSVALIVLCRWSRASLCGPGGWGRTITLDPARLSISRVNLLAWAQTSPRLMARRSVAPFRSVRLTSAEPLDWAASKASRSLFSSSDSSGFGPDSL